MAIPAKRYEWLPMPVTGWLAPANPSPWTITGRDPSLAIGVRILAKAIIQNPSEDALLAYVPSNLFMEINGDKLAYSEIVLIVPKITGDIAQQKDIPVRMGVVSEDLNSLAEITPPLLFLMQTEPLAS